MQIRNGRDTYNKSNPSFEMTVKFSQVHPSDELRDIIDHGLSYKEFSGQPYNILSIAKSSNHLFTEEICDCNVIGISNGKEAIMAHLIPNGSNLSNIDNFEKTAELKPLLKWVLQGKINKLRKNGEKLKAFLIGGQIYEQDDRRSISLYKGLLALLKKNGISPTIAWGQSAESGEMAAFYSIKDDALTIYPKSCQEYADINPLSVKRYFQILKFNKEDSVIINNKPQDKKQIAKINKDVAKTRQTIHGRPFIVEDEF